ncbi:MAG: hypothetical protein AB1458_12010 [Bacteroidota bacterium]
MEELIEQLEGLGRTKRGKAPKKKVQEKPEKKARKAKKAKKDTAEKVEIIAEPVKFIRRFKNMVGKEVEAKRVLTFIKSLQKAIHERRIRKGDPYSKEIDQIQGIAISHYERGKGKYIEIKPKADFVARIKAIAGSQKIRPSVAFLKRFVSLIGRPWRELKEPLEKLATTLVFMANRRLITESDKYYDKVEKARDAITYSLKHKTSLKIPATTLSGLNGIIAQEGGAGFL